MRLTLCLLAAILLVSTATAADLSRTGDGVEPVYTEYQDNVDLRATAIYCQINMGTFTDLTPAYTAALTALGVAYSNIYDPAGNWPGLGGADVVIVNSTDTWWSGTGQWSTVDQNLLTDHLAAGPDKKLLLVGQDWLQFAPGSLSWVLSTFGATSIIEDVLWAIPAISWWGEPGGVWEGLSESIVACFAANDFYSDQVFPTYQGVIFYDSGTFAGEGGSQSQNGNAVFSTVEVGCGSAAVLQEVVNRVIPGVTPTESSTWGSLKTNFR